MTESMTDPQHKGGWTPGPWKACGTIYEHMNAEIRSGAKGEGQGIAQVWDGPNAFKDALMMAAAPELFEALEAILHTYDDGGVPLRQAFEMANAALAKASPDKSGGA